MTDVLLWTIFLLLFLAFVLQIIRARRGPWPSKGQQSPNRAPTPPLSSAVPRPLPKSTRHVRIIN